VADADAVLGDRVGAGVERQAALAERAVVDAAAFAALVAAAAAAAVTAVAAAANRRQLPTRPPAPTVSSLGATPARR
jgi:hypothetical protein